MNRLTLLVLLLVAACGDNKSQPDARERVDSSPPDAHVLVPRALAAAGDFMSPGTGLLSRLDVESMMMHQNLVASAVQGDPALRQFGDKVYVINRFGSNNVTILDAKTLAFVEQISTGTNSNPQDVAVVGGKLYVPAMGTAGVVVLTPGSAASTTIDLSSLDTMGMNDGKPDCISAYAVDTKVFVVCGVLDNFNAVEVGKVAIIDTATDTMVGSLPLNYKNPYGLLERAPADSTYTGDLLIPTVPSFTNYATGCLERISTTATAAGCGLTNQELGGFVNRTSVSADGSLLYLAVGTYDTSFQNPTGVLKGFDLASGMLWAAPLSTTSELIIDVAACPGGDVVATDQTLNAGGLRVWRGTSERTTAAMGIGLPPTTNALVCYDAG